MAQPRPVRARFEEKVNRDGPIPEQRPELGPCWEWTAGRYSNTGYGQFGRRVGGKWIPTNAHRIAYELYVGPIPEGTELDHLCRNRGCVKVLADGRGPAHLEPVTRQVNMLRGEHPSALAVRTNRCKRGHEYTPENTILRADSPSRQCRECKNIHQRSEAYLAAQRRRRASRKGGGAHEAPGSSPGPELTSVSLMSMTDGSPPSASSASR